MLVVTDNWNTTYFLDNESKITVLNMFHNNIDWGNIDKKHSTYLNIGLKLLEYATEQHINIFENKFDVETPNKERIRILFDGHKFNQKIFMGNSK